MPGASAPAGFSLPDRLREHPYFHDLSPDSLDGLSQAALRRTFEAGEMLFLEGDSPAGMWLVEAGQVKVFKLSVDGREHILRMPGPGESFNDISALDGGPNAASAAALSDLSVWVISPAGLAEAVRHDPALALALVRVLTGRVRMLVGQIEDLALYNVQARLARFLLAEAERDVQPRDGVTRAAIAAHLATTPESISRALRQLEEAGAIRFDRHRIVIVDEAALRDLAQV